MTRLLFPTRLFETALSDTALLDDLEEACWMIEDGDEAEASDEVLAQLFGGKVAGDDEDEEEDEEDEEEEDEEEEKAEKKASSNRRPKVRKASKGARSLGSVTKAATSEVNDLSKLWTMAPDVSDVFGK